MRDSLVDRRSVERLLLISGAVRAGLIDALAREGARPAEEVATIAGADPRAVRVVLEALAAEGIVDRVVVDGSALYRLSALGRTHLLDEGPDLERSGLLHLANRVRGWLDLPEVIHTGRPLQKDPARRDVCSFVSAMGEREPEILDEIVERSLAFAGRVRTMIDIGGAVGHMARQFSRCGVRATLLDRANVMPIAEQFLGEEGSDIAFVSGDFTKSLPPGPFDLAYLGNVFHIYGPETDARLVREVHAIVSPGGTIAIQDHVWGRSPRAAMFAVNMLQATEDGGVWTEEQYRLWLSDGGFGEVEIVDLDTTQSQLIMGRKARSQA
jgi:SAM-dependent methyltransferase/DNA-binding transcriptional ArsR family regulator